MLEGLDDKRIIIGTIISAACGVGDQVMVSDPEFVLGTGVHGEYEYHALALVVPREATEMMLSRLVTMSLDHSKQIGRRIIIIVQ